jgi:hypothetical protein
MLVHLFCSNSISLSQWRKPRRHNICSVVRKLSDSVIVNEYFAHEGEWRTSNFDLNLILFKWTEGYYSSAIRLKRIPNANTCVYQYWLPSPEVGNLLRCTVLAWHDRPQGTFASPPPSRPPARDTLAPIHLGSLQLHSLASYLVSDEHTAREFHIKGE